MPLVNIGRDLIAAALIGAPINADFDTSNSYIGVGDSTTNATPLTYTDLQASSNKFRKVSDGSFPQRSANVLTFKSTFATGDANFAWQEWGVFNHTSNSTTAMLNRKVESLGTKTSAQTWVATVTLTVTAA
jgi:hypothetical protein